MNIDKVDHEIRLDSNQEKYVVIYIRDVDGNELKVTGDAEDIMALASEIMLVGMKANTISKDRCLKDSNRDDYTIIS